MDHVDLAVDVTRADPEGTRRPLYSAVYGSPFGNEMLLSFADEVIRQERLGQRNTTDLLSISFSSNDSVGHTHGPDSPHVRDISIRTDRVIGQLLTRIDALVGLQHTVIAFTTDHGVAPVPDPSGETALGGRVTAKDLMDPIQAALSARFGEGKWVLATAGTSPYLNDALIEKLQLDPVEVRRVAAAAAITVRRVARVYTRDQLLRGDVPADPIGSRVLRGFNAQRSGDLEIILEPYWMRQATGTTHGSPYDYDSSIPLILMGARIKPGQYAQPVALNDLAPTLATVARVPIPSGSSGRVLTEAVPAAARCLGGAGKRGASIEHRSRLIGLQRSKCSDRARPKRCAWRDPRATRSARGRGTCTQG